MYEVYRHPRLPLVILGGWTSDPCPVCGLSIHPLVFDDEGGRCLQCLYDDGGMTQRVEF